MVAPISSGRGIGRASRIATRVALATSDQPAQGDHTRKTSGHIIVVECRLLQSEELSARMEEAELDAIRRNYLKLAAQARQALRTGGTDTGVPDVA